MIAIVLILALLQPDNEPASQSTSQPTSQPTSKPTKKVVEYQLPPDTDFLKLVGPIARNYGVSMPAKSFQELRSLRFTPDGQMDHLPLPDAKGKVQYGLVVPPSYGNGEKPFGLMVWIAPQEAVEDRRDWRPLFEKYQLIFIAPHDVENETHTAWRVFMALESVRQMKSRFNIDPDRIYVSGMSGGGRVSSHTAVFFPDVFSGAFAQCGCNFYRNAPAEKKNEVYPGFWPNPVRATIDKGRPNTRLVLLTGTEDFNRPSTKAAYDAYVADNWKYVTYLDVPGLAHQRPDAEWFEKGIVALDAPLAAMARTQYEKAIEFEKKRKLGDACLAFESAARHGGNESFTTDAAHRGQVIRQKYTDRLANAKNLVENRKFDQANVAARELRVDYGPLAAEEVDKLFARIRELKKTGT